MNKNNYKKEFIGATGWKEKLTKWLEETLSSHQRVYVHQTVFFAYQSRTKLVENFRAID